MSFIDSVQSASRLLQEKTEFFLQYEELTDKMLTEDTEDLSEYIDQRQALAAQIDSIDGTLKEIYTSPDGEALKKAVTNQLNWVDCPDLLKDIFMIGQQLIAVLSRISRKDKQVEIRVEERKEQLLSLIREQNSGISSKAEKYYRTSKHLEKNPVKFSDKY